MAAALSRGALVAGGAALLVAAPAADASTAPRPVFVAPWTCGEARDYYHHRSEVANALDFNLPGSADAGKPVLAAAAGTVHRITTAGGYGNRIELDHGGGWRTLSAHLRLIRPDLRKGSPVGVREPLGEVGSTGNSSGPHLHFEQRRDGSPVRIVLDGQQLALTSRVNRYTSSCAPAPAPAPPAPAPASPPPGAPATVPFNSWGSGVRVREAPALGAAVVGRLGGPTPLAIRCQSVGDTVTAEGYTNPWWSHIPALGGWISNIYVDHPAYQLPGVPSC